MKHQYIKNVATLALNAERCVGCSRCVDVCPHNVFDIADGKARIIRRDDCVECGACALNCPAAALSVHAGVGCASAIVRSWFTGGEPSCDCGGGSCC